MNKQIREKRIPLLATAGATLALTGIIWYFLVNPLQEALRAKALEIPELKEKIKVAKNTEQLADKMNEDLETARNWLVAAEQKMPEGDLYRWMINQLLAFQSDHEILFADFDPPQPGQRPGSPNLPYSSATFNVTGTGTYHAFGKFLADLENSFPHSRLRRIELEPASATRPIEEESNQLFFRIEFTAFVRPTRAL